MHKIVFVNRYCYPDESATSQLVSDLAFSLARDGFQVHLIASRQLHNDPLAVLPVIDEIEEVQVKRVWTSRWGRRSLPGRALDYFTFYFSASAAVFKLVRRGDVVVAKTDPPLLGSALAVVCWLRRCRLVNWLQDIYPEIAEHLNVAGPALLGRVLRGIRNQTCRGAARNVAIGRCMQEHLLAEGISPERMTVIPNWVNDDFIQPLPAEQNPLRQAWGLENRFVVGYSGNMGLVHDFDSLLAAAHQLRKDQSIEFLLIGDGARRSELEARVHMSRLDCVMFQPSQPVMRLNHSLTLPDVHIVTLRADLVGLIVPSKAYGALAAGRPVIFVGPGQCEIARLIREWNCGICMADVPGESLAAVIVKLRDDPARCALLGANARRALEESCSRAKALEAWRQVVGDLVRSPVDAVASTGTQVTP